LNAKGKIDRNALPAPESDAFAHETYVAPGSPKERVLVEIWEKVLSTSPIGVADNFFALGGDSILSIQVVAQAKRRGFSLTTQTVLEHPTVAALALRMIDETPANAPLTLLPMQRQFFRDNPQAVHHCHQSLLVSVPERFDLVFMRAFVAAMYERHDALRLRFSQREGEWQATHAVVTEAFINESAIERSVCGLSEQERNATFISVGQSLKESIDITRGPLLRAVFFRADDWRDNRLLLVIHRLVVDGASWGILLNDLEQAAQQWASPAGKKAIALADKTHGVDAWGRKLSALCHAGIPQQEKSYWTSLLSDTMPSLPVDGAVPPEDCYGRSENVRVECNAALTGELLDNCHHAYHTRIDDLLLSSLLLAVSKWTGQTALRLSLEGHGREALFDGIDISQSVGCFSTVSPVTLRLSPNWTAGTQDSFQELITRVKEDLRKRPHDGLGYGLLRHMRADADLLAHPEPNDILFSYVGPLPAKAFSPASEESGSDFGPQLRRTHKLTIDGFVRGGRLCFDINFNPQTYARATVANFGRELEQSLGDIVSHCRQQQRGRFSPSDFPLVSLRQEEIDALQARYPSLADCYAASDLQSGLIFHALMDEGEGSDVYTAYLDLTIEAHIDVARFKTAWNRVAERHDCFRSAFTGFERNQILQVVLDRIELPWTELDWRNKSDAELPAAFDAYALADRSAGFDLAAAPLMRLTLIREKDDRYRFLWTLHHSVLDGWSLTTVVREVIGYYGDLPAVAPPVTGSYKNYLSWLRSRDSERAREFWTKELRAADRRAPLSLRRPAADSAEVGRKIKTWRLSAKQAAAIEAFAKRSTVTMNVVLLASWAHVLSRYSGSDTVVLGQVVSGRDGDIRHVEDIVGLLVRTIPVCIDVDATVPTGEWLKRLHARTVELEKYGYLPLPEIQRCRGPSSEPLFDSLFMFGNYPDDLQHVHSRSLPITQIVMSNTTNYDLTLRVLPMSGLGFELTYRCERFTEASIDQLMRHFIVALEGMAAQKHSSVAELPLLSMQERQQQLVEWNSTARPYPHDRCIQELFEAQARLRPDAIAVVHDRRQLSYSELNRRANRVAHALRKHGVGPEARVGICMERSPELAVGLLGILKAGGAYVPLDPEYPESRLEYMLSQSGCRVVLSEQHLMMDLPLLSATKVLPLDAELHDTLFGAYSDANVTDSGVCPTNLAYVIYTSGSTGRPKGSAVLHQNISRLIYNSFVDYENAHTILCAASPSFDAFTFELWGALLHGGRSVMSDSARAGFSELGKVIDQQGVDCAWLTSSLFNRLIDDSPDSLRRLKRLLVGGEALSIGHVRQALRRLPRTVLINGYGPTENTTFSCTYTIAKEAALFGHASVPIGHPIGNTQAYVLDVRGELVPMGVVGELYLGGAGLARGYLGQAGLTAQKFIPNGFSRTPGERLYRTGDRVRYLPDGNVEFLGRVDHQVKVRGFRIELGEIESVLHQHEPVREAVVLAREDEPGERSLVAYVVAPHEAREARTLQLSLMEHLRERLPDYMVPAALMLLDALPLTVNKKVDVEALPEPDDSAYARAAYQAPETPIEQALAELWKNNLGLETVGTGDNYFSIGGDSIRSIALVAEAKRRGLRFSVKDLFSYRTIKALVQVIEVVESGEQALPEIPPFSLLTDAEQKYIDERYDSAEIEDAFPLSTLQQGLIYHSFARQELSTYHDILTYQIRERWDATRFEKALAHVVARHAILRTIFDLGAERPIQVVFGHAQPAVEAVEIADPASATHRVEQWIEQEKQRGVDLSSYPWKIRVHVVSDHEFVLGMSFHHALYDGWSNATFLNELLTAYASYQQHDDVDPLALPPSYKHFVVLEQQALASQENASYWHNKLEGAKLPWWTGDLRERSASISHQVSEDASNRLRALSATLDVQEKSVWTAVYLALVSLLDGSNDVVASVATHGRPELPGSEQTLGLFLNSLPVRVDLSGMRWSDLIVAAEAELQALSAVRQFPLVHIQAQMGMNFSAALFNYVNFHVYEKNIVDRQLTLGNVVEETNYAITFQVEKFQDLQRYGVHINLDPTVFDANFRERIQGYVVSIIEQMLARSHESIDKATLLGSAERTKLLTVWNNPARIDYAESCVHELFEAQALRSAGSIAVTCGEETLSYAALDARANQLARYLQAKGVGPDRLVGICMERGVELGVAVLGVLKAGGAYLPLDPSLPPKRLTYMLEDAAPSVVLTQEKLQAALAPTRAEVISLDSVSRELDALADAPVPKSGQRADQLVYVIYTSGSTGLPKGTAMTHGSMVNLIEWHRSSLEHRDGERVLQFAALSFDVAFQELFSTLCTGGTLVLLDEWVRRDARALLQFIGERQIQKLFVPPAMLQGLAESFASTGLRPAALQDVICAGEQLRVTPEVVHFFEQLEGCRLHNHYGPTETHVVTALTLGGHPNLWPARPSIGRPIQNVQIHLLDREHRLVPGGVVGELYIGGAALARGYLNRATLTSQSFICNPFDGKSRLYKTGDVARWLPDGTLEYLGRADHQVKVRGYRIELGEIESVLLAHDGVRDAVVVAREDSGDKRLVSYVVAKSSANDSAPLIRELRSRLQEQLPVYMVPATFVILKSLPLTATGKVDRRQLPAPEETTDAGYAPPDGMTEQLLAELWGGVLKRQRVGRDDHFFELGGHSLLAMQLALRIREAFSTEFPLRELFEHPTLSSQARAVEQARGVGMSVDVAMEPVSREQPLPLSYAQQRLWFLHQYMGPSSVYNMPLALRLHGAVNEAALIQSLRELQRRHESMRTRFESRDGGVVQVIDPPRLDITVEAMPAADVESIVHAEHNYSFDLSSEPLCRVRLLCETDTESVDYVLLVTMHHSVTDGWSLGVLFRELVTLYRAFANAEDSPLTPLPIQYADYAQWQRGWLQGDVLENQLSYWREQLKEMPPLLTLPTDRPRPSQQTFQGSTERFDVSASLAEKLQALSREQGVTLFMTLLSGWAVLLSRYSGQSQVAIGTPVANRTRRETEGLIGFFVNMLVMRADLRGDPRFVDLLKQTREMALQAYAHQDIPFEQMVDALNPVRSAGHSPLFQVAFGLLNTPFEAPELPGLTIQPLQPDAGDEPDATSRFDMTLYIRESASGLLGGLEYNTDLFDRDSIRQLLSHYERLLAAIVASPQSRLSQLKMLSEQERHRQLIEWNATVRASANDQCIHEFFEAQAELSPEAIAIADDDRQLTYRGLNERANQFAHRLIKRGVDPYTRVAICIEPGVDRAVGVLGILKAGAAYVPLDAERVERLDHLLEDSDAELVVTSAWVRDEVLRKHPGTKPAVTVKASALACVRYELDAAGAQVGRMISHSGLVEQCSSEGWLESLLTWPTDWPAALATQTVARYVLDRDGELLPVGAVGELHVGGEAAGWGYQHRSGLTAERFVPNAFSTTPGGRLYRTGKRAHWTADGRLQLVDEQPEPLRSPGDERLGTERALCNHEAVREAVVLQLEAAQGEPRLVAYVVERTPGSVPTKQFISQLKAHLRSQPTFCPLPHEWMVLECLPRAADGAVDRSGLPQPESTGAELAYVAPRTSLERTLVEVWQEQLGIERVGVEDNYFAVGGDSIRSISLVAEAHKRGARFAIKDLFAYPTVAGLAVAIERGEVRSDVEVDEIKPFALLTSGEREQLGQRHDLEAVEDAYPLSMMQQGMVVEALRHSDLQVYLNFQIYEFKDPWDASLFEQALQHLLARHPMLRTVHDFAGERPLQLVLKQKPLELHVVDVRHLDKAGIEAALEQWTRSEQAIGLDTTLTLWRASVHVMASGQFLFGMYLHHALWDGWSLESFATELYATYGLLKREGRITQRRRLPSYNRFIALEQSAVSSKEHRDYWTGKLADATAPWWMGREKSPNTYLPCDLSQATSRRLSELARALGVQEKSVWCSVYLTLLSLLSGSDDGLGTVITQGRPEIPDGDKIIGVFLNALPTRVRVSGRRWAELIAETDRELREQHAFRHCPLAEIQRLTGLDFASAMFGYVSWHVYLEGVDREGTRAEWVPQKVGGWQDTNYLLNFIVYKDDQSQRFELSIGADSGVFDAAFRERIRGYALRIVDAILSDVTALIEKTRLLDDEERRQQLVEWTATTRSSADDTCIHKLFEAQAQLQPDAVALAYDEGQLTFRDLNRRANGLAHHLIARGVGPEVRVGLCLPRSPERMIGQLGILKAGGCYVPLDPECSTARLEYLIEHSGCQLVLNGESPAGFFDTVSDANVSSEVHPTNLAAVIYTSDHTGQPQGHAVEHRNIGQLLHGEELWSAVLSVDQPQAYVLDRDGEILPTGVVGELYLGGAGLARGYFAEAGLTAEKFVPSAYARTPGERLYRTGDLVRWLPNGNLEHIGTMAQQAQTRSLRSELGEIENVLLAHETVRDAVVLSQDAPQSEPRLVAYVVERPPAATPEFVTQLRKLLRTQPTASRLPHDWMVLESLPRTAAGAVDRSALPQPEGFAGGRAYVAPRTPLEAKLVEVWQEQLGIERIGIEDNYFALGGDSIRSISLVAQSRKRGVEFSIKDLFAHPTICGLASAIERGDVRSDANADREIEPFALLTTSERQQLAERRDIDLLDDAYPLSMMQQGMVAESLRYADLQVYQNGHCYQFNDAWDPELFGQALRHLMSRHSMLRTRYDFSGERPLQLVLKEMPLELHVVDVRHLDKAAIQAALVRWEQQESSKPLDMASSLWRLTIHVLNEQSFIFGMYVHHAQWDGWSLESFATELYATFGLLKREGRIEQRRRVPSYNRFIALEQAAVCSEEHRKHWARKLEGATVPWWTGRVKSASTYLSCDVSQETSQRMAELARRLGVQEKSVWCSVYLALLALLSGTDEGLGTVMTQGRPEIPGGEKIIGVFLNGLPLRAGMSGKRWVELIIETDRELREQHAFRQYPLIEIQRLTGLDFSAAMFGFVNFHVYYEGVDHEGTREEWIPQKVGGWQDTNYLLNFIAHKDEQSQRMDLMIGADSGVFDAAFRDRIRGYAVRIIDEIASDATVFIDKTRLLGVEERQQQLIAWNATTQAYPQEQCIHQLFEAQAERTPDRIAVVHEGTELTYAELNRRANGLARQLIERGVAPEVRVGLCMRRSIETAVGMLGVLKAGGCYVPLNPESPAARLEYLRAQSNCRLVLSDKSHAELFETYSDANVDSAVCPTNLAYVLYAAGDTGQLQGTAIAHRNLNRLIHSDLIDRGDVRTLLCSASPWSDAFTFELWSALLHGGRCVMTDADGANIRRHEIDCALLTTQRFDELIVDSAASLKQLKHLMVSGEAASIASFREGLRLLPETALSYGYGPTENTTFSCFCPVGEKLSDWSTVPMGRPIANTQAYVLDGAGDILPTGVVGELYLGGAGLARGYLAQAGLTAEKFVPSAYAQTPGERLYRTGDLVRHLPDGALEFVGRVDPQVKARGSRTELGDIEQTLRSHQDVRDVAVLSLEASQDEPRLAAYIVERTPGALAAEKFIAQLKAHLRTQTNFSRLPHEWMLLESLPRTVAGAVDRSGLPQPEGIAGLAYVAPRTPLEKKLVEVWQEQLGIERVGSEDHYFALGGDSIRAISLVAQASKRGVYFSIKDLFAYPTVSALASAIERGAVRGDVNFDQEIEPFALLTQREREQLGERHDLEAIEDAYPLSMMQQGMVVESLRREDLKVYQNGHCYHFSDAWDPQLFERALSHLMARHPMLRTVYDFSGERPLQLVLKQMAPGLNVVDLRHLDQAAIQAALEAWEEQQSSQSLDLSKALWRLTIHVLSEQSFVFGMFVHHAQWDGWSLESFATELYATFGLLKKEGRTEQRRRLPSYNRFVALEQAAMASEEHRKYWARKLEGATVPWWTGREKSASAYMSCDVSQATSDRLTELARALGVQEKSIWCSVYLALLALLSGTDEAVGSVMTQGRPEIPGGEKMVGVFLNALPLRVAMSGRWADLIVQTDRELAEQHEFRRYPLVEIQRLAGLDLAAATFNYSNFHVYYDGIDGQGTKAEWMPHKVGGWQETNYLLNVFAQKDDKTQRYYLDIGVDPQIFDGTLRERIRGYIANIVNAMAHDATALIETTQLLSEAERRQQLIQWNASERAYPKEQCIHRLFEAQAEQTPDRIALVYEHSQLSYAELNRRANRLAHRLIERGIGPEVPVGLCMPRSVEMMVGLLAILKAGGCYVPLDPGFPRKRLAYMLEDSGAAFVVDDVNGGSENLPDTNPKTDSSSASTAYVIYTSGSTGAPKGVRVSHGNVVNFMRSMQESPGIASNDRLLAVTTLSFDIALLELFLPLTVGATVDIASAASVVDGERLIARLEQSRITVLQATPVTWKLLLDSGWQGQRSLTALVGGEAFPRELAARIVGKVGQVWNVYGPTETTIWSTRYRVTESSETWTVPIGQPLANTQVYVLDRRQRLVPAGVAGELYLGGAGVAQGYLARPALTAERFVPNPYGHEVGERLYRTGDLARWLPDGTLEYLSRVDHQVKVRGYRIELGEIESVLLAHDAVRDAVVVAREDAGNKRLVAYVVAEAGVQVDEVALLNALRSRLQEQLPGYMVPSAFLVLDSLPLTANGKVDRKALPAPEASVFESDYVPPEGPTEELLAELWCQLLKHQRVGRHASFFELGGHSLLTTQLASHIREAFSTELPIRELFEHQTLSSQARAIERARGASALVDVAMEAVSREQPLPLSYSQQRLWFLHQYMGPNAVYNMPLALRLHGAVNEAALIQSLEELHRRHEALRTRFESRDQSVVQVIDPPGLGIAVEVVSAGEAEAIAHAERFHCFDLSSERLCRIRVLREPGDYVLVMTIHHSVSDGWSLGIFFREFVSLYRAFANAEDSPLAPLPIQYADYAQWQRQWLQGEVLDRQVSYWREQLTDLPPLLTLPTDRPRPVEQTFHGSVERFALPAQLSQKLQALSREQGVTLYMTLLSAFAVLLGRYSGQHDLAVGTPIANRTRRETEGLIGFFVNTLVMRSDLSGDPRFVDLLKRTRAMAVQAYAHQDVPFEQLVEELNPQRSLSHSPLFQVMFMLQNMPLEAIELPGLAVHALGADQQQSEGTARFDLTLGLQESAAGLVGGLEYNTDLFERGTIQRMLNHYTRLLEAIVAAPQAHLSRLEMLGDAERHRQLVEWNATTRPYPQEQCIHELFEAQALRNENAMAVVCGEETLSYAVLNARANQLARYLQVKGVGPDRLVGICMERSVELIVAMLGVLKAGGAYVPLDPSHPTKRLAYMLADAAPSVVLTQEKLKGSLASSSAEVIALDSISEELAALGDVPVPKSGLSPEHLVYVIYTSGSTGLPKGTAMAHGSMVNLIEWHRSTFASCVGERVLQFAALSFDVAFQEIFYALCTGGTLVLLDEWVRRDADALLKLISKQKIRKLFLPPVMLQSLAESFHTTRVLPVGLEDVICAGEQLRVTAEVASFFEQLEGCRLHNHYGPTEAHVVTALTLSGSPKHWPARPSIGQPIQNIQIHVLDRELALVPIGAVGELYIGGVSLARGYLNKAALTAGAFVHNPFDQGTRLYRTGDLARRLPDGALEYLGRADHQVKVRGFRIELGEIESALLAHETVRDAVVVARMEQAGETRLVGYVVVEPGESIDEAALLNALRARLQEQLPRYMVPSAFVVLESLPLTATGKVDRKALPAPEESAAAEHTPAEGPTEELLAELWCLVLKRERVGRHENFFEIGGHSLLATQLVSRIRDAFSTELPVRRVFEHATLSSQARAIEQSRDQGLESEIPLEAVSREEPLPLSYAQQRMLFLHEYTK